MIALPATSIDTPRLHLLPSAPRELAEEVYQHVVWRLEQARHDDATLRRRVAELQGEFDITFGPRAQPRPARSDRAQPDGGGARHRPWELLHVEPDAPPDIVEVAYRFWARTAAGHAPDGAAQAKRSPLARASALASRLRRAPRHDTPSTVVPIERATSVAAPVPQETNSNGIPEPSMPAAMCDTQPITHVAQLIDAAGAAAVIGERPVRVGTARNCDVVVETDEKGGYVEARLWSYDGRVVLHAVGVRSRVVVNGQPVAWAVLEHGDRIELAGHEFRLEIRAS